MSDAKRECVGPRSVLRSCGLILSVLLIAGPVQAQWTAYNDCVYDAALNATGTDPAGQSVTYQAANVTDFGIGVVSADSPTYTASTQYPNTAGTLLNQADGVSTGVTATFTQNGAVATVNWQPQVAPTWTGGYDTAAGTDAHTIFNGIADMTGVIYYGGVGWWVDLTLTGLDPANTYTFVTSASRAKQFTDGGLGYNTRDSLYTLVGSDAATNNSSAGVTEVAANPLTLSMNTGNNHTDGRVIRWDDIDPGADGTITIRAESAGGINQAYTFDVFMLEEIAGGGGTCGDGTLDAGEDCDNGASNGTPGQCCSGTCSFESAATECRASAGICDVAETCTGASGICPLDGVESATTECRASAGSCDVAENCDGVGTACPADVLESATTECRAAAGVCDAADLCDGVSATCGADLKLTNECRASAGACDAAELCDGVGDNCPADVLESATTECRAAAGVCDAADLCDGVSATCGADLKLTSECRASADLCDAAEVCDGVGNNCPADVLESATTECRAAGGACDVAESCDGVTAACPADVLVAAATECRASGGFCDVAESCTGVDAACPTDVFKPSTVGCRGTVASCDLQENCTGADALCPPDGFKSASAVCRPQNFACDVEELCTGGGPFCPFDTTLNVGDPCSNGDACSLAEECLPGLVCGAGTALDCDDGNECTADSCDSETGCGHSPIPNCASGLPASSDWSIALLALMFVMGGALLLERQKARTNR